MDSACNGVGRLHAVDLGWRRYFLQAPSQTAPPLIRIPASHDWRKIPIALTDPDFWRTNGAH